MIYFVKSFFTNQKNKKQYKNFMEKLFDKNGLK